MSLPLIQSAVWFVAAAVAALRAMRRPVAPGISLLICAPVLLSFARWQQGVFRMLFGTFASASLFRRPLTCFARCAFGLPALFFPEPAPELYPGFEKDRA